jgi:chemotaxis protein methyltransferase CheR
MFKGRSEKNGRYPVTSNQAESSTHPLADDATGNVSDEEFGLFQKLIYDKAGLFLSSAKKALLEARLTRRLRDLGLASFGAYYRYVINDPRGNEIVKLLDSISTNETHFFREPRQFEFLEQQILPQWKTQAESGAREKRIRVWSAGCSTGEEPYSIAMTLLDHFPQGCGWELDILATDLSTRVLALAEAAVWPIAKANEIPAKHLKQFMLKGTGAQEGKMKAGAEIQSLVRLKRLNLNEDQYPVGGQFDLIFCRNVLIYFDARSRARVVHRLLDHLAPSGFLFVGHAESLSSVTDRVSYIIPTIYGNATDQPLTPKMNAATRKEESFSR